MWGLAAGFLLADPIWNSVLVTNIAARRDGALTDVAAATYAAVLDDGGTVVGAAMRTPPHPIALSPMPAGAVAPLVEALAATCPDASGVHGPVEAAERFAAGWRARTGAGLIVERLERLHRLDAVTAPPAPPGAWRLAEAGDRDLLVRWGEAFEVEVGLVPSGTVASEVDARLANARAFVWEDGEVVSYVATSGADIVRVGPVYTPPERRARGYASALVAAVSQRALDGGAQLCMLYTDLANPTSNRIYAAVGYRPIGDAIVYRFTTAGGTRAG
jgi:GNAT superfamily N-acetyltransferase